MKQKVELGRFSAGEVLCAGIVKGLYQCRNTRSEGALGWAADFPWEQATFVVEEFLGALPEAKRKPAWTSLLRTLAEGAPEWIEGLQRTANRVVKD
jgi:hypothetical protein